MQFSVAAVSSSTDQLAAWYRFIQPNSHWTDGHRCNHKEMSDGPVDFQDEFILLTAGAAVDSWKHNFELFLHRNSWRFTFTQPNAKKVSSVNFGNIVSK